MTGLPGFGVDPVGEDARIQGGNVLTQVQDKES
jgi:hypothetical protein